MNFLTEHGIDNYDELAQKATALNENAASTLSAIKQTEQRMTDLSLLMKNATTYRKLKPVYDNYRKSADKEKFLRGT